ncbi:glycosyltransferase 8 domain-containing protein 1 [Lingula anatina]|uniref:Glycosyltransferase 8 domain-containing protein 1 n=1 Tax=Lingula anatina TaxID=7574 RepID=A0A1S3IZA2_LINAN|nr:glycosyltransferase 8 domain-containing protein 1 [Lingula anatina]|eukprot:XP_013402879.2 glycosyltransferase 8 domain-containing protein 1 [Lingula anatina]
MVACKMLFPRITPRRVALCLVVATAIAILYVWNPGAKKTRPLKRSFPQIIDETSTKHSPGGSKLLLGNCTGQPTHVLLTADSAMLGGMIAAVNSIHLNAKCPVKFHLVTTTDCAKHLRTWIQATSLSKIDYELLVFNKRLVTGMIKLRGGREELSRPIVYARFFVPTLLPDLQGRVVYVDSDVIVQGDIGELNKTRIRRGHAVAVSEDCNSVSKRFSHIQNNYQNYINFKNPSIKRLKMSPLACSFNPGVFAMDITTWKQTNMTLKIQHWLQLNTWQEVYGTGIAGGAAQPPMMIALYKRFSLLNPMWNVRHLGMRYKKMYSDQFISRAKLIHWDGPTKPWDGGAQFSKIWDKYYIPDPTGQFKVARRYGTV